MILKKIKLKNILRLLLIAFIGFSLAACNGKTEKILPDVTGLTVQEIKDEFQSKGLIVTFDFQDYFEKGSVEGVFKAYGNELKVGDEIEAGTTITIYITSNSIILPDLQGLTSDEIKATLERSGVTSRDISVRPDDEINKSVPIGTFTRYEGFTEGDKFDFTKKLVIYYNNNKVLPDITGKNRFEIEDMIATLQVSYEFEYILDNNKEYDSFASYQERQIGDQVSGNDLVVVNLYKNDDVNIGNLIVNDFGIFISKYADGEGSNQAIELYNPTSAALDLADYYIAILENGSLSMTQEVRLTGTLASEATFVIAKKGATQELLQKADLVSENLTFDGNDTIQLRKTKNNTFIDTIYHVGNISRTMDEEIFVRKTPITTGNREFKQIEWLGYIPSYLDPIGTHPWLENDISGPEFELISDFIFLEYGMTKVLVTRVADGDTIYLDSLDPRDPTSYQGDQRIRFLMVDTPETTKPDVVGEPYADVATLFTKKLVEEKATEVYIQSDRSAGLTETYGRYLGLVWFKIEEDVSFNNIAKEGTITIKAGWHLLNYELVKYGLGTKSIAKTNKYKEAPIFSNRYLYQWGNEAELFAIENEMGLYSGVNRS